MTLHHSSPSLNLLVRDRKECSGRHIPSQDTKTQRLVVVSNRVADLHETVQSGGLVVGLGDAIAAQGGVWFGWDGDRNGKTGGPLKVSQHGKVTTVGLPISPEDFSEYYLGFSNSVLWPLFHYRLDLVDITAKAFDGYMRVNEVFARQLLPILKPDDLIWIHDYHLLPLAAMLRKLGCQQRIGHFLHIPFPSPELLSATPQHGVLVDALLEYDLLGFQTNTDMRNLTAYLRTHKPEVAVHENQLHSRTKTTQIGRFPIGIDVEDFATLAKRPNPQPSVVCDRSDTVRRTRIIGVDRLDYSKGLPERFRAFETLLTRHPEHQKKVGFVQIAPLTRTEVDAYAEIRIKLEQLAGSINGRYADLDWTPVQYLCRPLSRDVLAPLMRESNVGFVTPLRDGMNLVAKEYVAAQDPDDPGVLVLSQFAGAAEEMREALIVNPYDTENMAQQLHAALTMSLEERRDRHHALLRHIRAFDAKNWAQSYLAALKNPF